MEVKAKLNEDEIRNIITNYLIENKGFEIGEVKVNGTVEIEYYDFEFEE